MRPIMMRLTYDDSNDSKLNILSTAPTKSTTTTTTTAAPTTGNCTAEECLLEGNIDFTVNFLYVSILVNYRKKIFPNFK